MRKNILLSIFALLALGGLLNASNAHLITQVRNMIKVNDTYFITKYIEAKTDYKNLGSVYHDLLTSLSANNEDLEYSVIFAKAGAIALLDKAEELQRVNVKMSEKLKKSACLLLDKSIAEVYAEWLNETNDGTFLLKNALDMMKLSSRINTQLNNEIIEIYNSYLAFGELYLAIDDFPSALEHFRFAKELSSQLETQEYADIADIYISLSESNSCLVKDGNIFDYAEFINKYNDYLRVFASYNYFVANKSMLKEVRVDGKIEYQLDAMAVSREESKERLARLIDLNDRIFGDYKVIKG